MPDVYSTSDRSPGQRKRLTVNATRHLLPILLVLGAGAACSRESEPSGDERVRPANTTAKRSVLLISVCSVRADHLGCYGYARKTSPHIDALADAGVLFEYALTQWPKTAPAFCSIHTGLYPHTTDVMRITPRQRLDDSFTTLAECFRAAGYRTAAFVSTPALNRTLNLTQGFDVYEETFRVGPEAFEITTDWAIDWLGAEPGRPALLWAHFNNAHVPYVPPPDLRPLFVDDAHYDTAPRVEITAPNNDLPVAPDHPFAEQITRGDLGGVHPQFALRARPNERAYYVAQYDAAIYWADRCIGKLLDAAAALPAERRPIIALVGDHGESLGEHNYFFEHGRLPYDDVLRVPLLLRLPDDGSAARRVAEPVGVIDLMPTLLELARVPASDGIEGRSLLPLLRNDEPRGDVFFAAGYQLDFITGLRRGNWKLTHVPNEMDRRIMTGSEYELYDLAVDPRELDNLYDRCPDVAAPLRQALLDWKSPWWERAVQTIPGGAAPQIDEQTLQKLKELGYLRDDG